jgi:hypothetical protein
MPKIVLTTLIVAGILIFIMGISFFFRKKILGFGSPKPKSDVKIVYKIAWWAYQKCLTVDKLETKVLNNKLNLFNSRALVEYSISGNLKYLKRLETLYQICIYQRTLDAPSSELSRLPGGYTAHPSSGG